MPDDPTIEARVRGIIERVSKIAPGYSSAADLFRELGVKSAVALDLLLTLEEDFDVSIADDAFGEARTVETLTTLIADLVVRREG